MAKPRTGYVYQEKRWLAELIFRDDKGNLQTVRQEATEAKSKAQAQLFLESLIDQLNPARVDGRRAYQDTRWFARFDYTDGSGKRRTIRRRAENKSQGRELLRSLLDRYSDNGQKSLDGDRMTFKDLADYYETTYLIEPQYVDGRKVAGLRGFYDQRLFLKTLRSYFAGDRKLRSITYGDLERFRLSRLATPIVFKNKKGNITGQRQRAIASVNRELALLRRMLNVALREGWINRNPFAAAVTLISLADERRRERILTRDEEERLLAASADRKAHLRAILITALDTGMRRGEIFKLKWSDVDFDNRVITVRAFNTKTMRERQVAMTGRLARELEATYGSTSKDPEALCFGITNNVKKSFQSARKKAGLPDVRFHDLRHTHATRLVSAHMPLSEVGRVLGHTQANTTYRYVNANVQTAQRAAAILDAFNDESVAAEAGAVN